MNKKLKCTCKPEYNFYYGIVAYNVDNCKIHNNIKFNFIGDKNE